MKDIPPSLSYWSVIEQVVDVVIGYFCERRTLKRILRLGHDHLEDASQVLSCPLHAQANQAQACPIVEDDDKNHAAADDLNVNVLPDALVVLGRELLLSQ